MENEIICPNCKQAIKVDESFYANIVRQVRDKEFKKELEVQAKQAEKSQKSAVDLAVAEKEKEITALQSKIDVLKKDQETNLVKAQSDLAKDFEAEISEYKLKLKELESKLANQEDILKTKYNSQITEMKSVMQSRDLALRGKYEKQVNDLQNQLKTQEMEQGSKYTQEIAELKEQLKSQAAVLESKYRAEIVNLQGQLDNQKNALSVEFTKELAEKNIIIERLANEKDTITQNNEIALASIKSQHEKELQLKDAEIAKVKEMKLQLSTKMLGETLEQHCENVFNQNRAMTFPRAYFEKDNEVVEGTKGDFVFRDYDENGEEYISIMFEMKNEADATASKHKNEDFFKKLDSDRKKKGCEYAVLVTMLEKDSELYNAGIVDVSYRFEKMYVVRPQFFLPIISLLSNGAKKALAYRKTIAELKAQNLDVVNFEAELNNFKNSFNNSCKQAGARFAEAIDGIDAAIKKLENIKESFRLAQKHLTTADNKASELTIKKLTKNSPMLRQKFEEARSEK